MIDTNQLKTYEKLLKRLGDDELMEAFHKAKVGHEAAPDGVKDQAYLMRSIAERMMIKRFGSMVSYHEKYPDNLSKKP